MPLTVTWSTGTSARTWSPGLPDTAALVGSFSTSVSTLASAQAPNPATVKRALGFAEPVLTLVAEVAGAGLPEMLVLRGAVAVFTHLLTRACSAESEPAPPSAPTAVTTFPWAA